MRHLKHLVSQNGVSSWLLFFVIAAAPFPFGSTSKSVVSFWCILLSVAVLFLSLRNMRRPQMLVVVGLLVIVAGYGVVLHEQVADHPWIAPFHPIWQEASDALGLPLKPSASIVKSEPLFALGAPLANILSLLLGVVIGCDRKRARQVMQIIAISGALYALYGVLSFVIDPEMLLWRRKTAYLENVTGTFINRNTAATYFGSCSVIWLLLLVERARRKVPKGRISWTNYIRRIPDFSAREYLPGLSAFLICLMAMFLTGSRAGVALSLLAMIAGTVIFLRNDLPPKYGIGIALAAGCIVALGLLQLMGGRVSGRFDAHGLADEGRIEAWRSTLRIIRDYPWFGTGMGTFAWSFPPYRSPLVSMIGVWDRAHSTPLELASEVGLPLAALIAVGWITMSSILITGVATRKRDVIPVVALIISILAILHSSLDFTLQISGYTIPFFALWGVGLAQSFTSEQIGPGLMASRASSTSEFNRQAAATNNVP